MKKTITLLTALLLILSCLAGGSAPAEEKHLSVVVTIFPIYDWVREITGTNTNIDIKLLLDDGVDLHSYQPTAQDILSISTADVFVYVGGESDAWVNSVLASAMNPSLEVVCLTEALGEDIKTEEIVEGMEHEHEHSEEHEEADHEHEEDEHEEHEHGEHEHAEADEHVWLSLRCAQKLVRVLADTLAKADPVHSEVYSANAAVYIDKLSDLDARYSEAAANSEIKTILFGDRFPFRYLADDYGLTYYAAFSGCSAESEASFQTIVFLAGKVDELGLPVVLTIENPKTRIAETVVQNTASGDQRILAMDSMQSTTTRDILNGVTYLSVMESNLTVLKEALTK